MCLEIDLLNHLIMPLSYSPFKQPARAPGVYSANKGIIEIPSMLCLTPHFDLNQSIDKMGVYLYLSVLTMKWSSVNWQFGVTAGKQRWWVA